MLLNTHQSPRNALVVTTENVEGMTLFATYQALIDNVNAV